MVSISLEVLPPPPLASHGNTNPFLNSSLAQCHHAPGVSTFCSCRVPESPPTPPPPSHPPVPVSVLPAIEEAQQIYNTLPATTFFLAPEHLNLMERLGNTVYYILTVYYMLFSSYALYTIISGGGNFGHVMKGIYATPHGQEVPVAVKTLKESQIVATGEVSH